MKILDIPQSGSTAGTTSSRNRFGQYRRTRAIPINPNTVYQQTARSRLAQAAAAWRGILQNLRDQWDAYGLAHPRVDSLGQTIYPTGLQCFIGVWAVLAQCGVAMNTTPPADPSWPSAGLSGATMEETDNFNVAFAAPPATDEFIAVYSSAALSPGKKFVGGLKFLGNVTHADVAPGKDFSAEFVGRTGGGAITGTKVRVGWCHVIAGVKGPMWTIDVVTTAP